MAKYSREYVANRKVKTNKKVLDGLNYLGNPNITNELDTENQDQTQQNNNMSYVNAGVGALNAYQMAQQNNNNLPANQRQGQSINAGVDSAASSLTPWYGYAKGLSNMGKGMVPNESITNQATGETQTIGKSRSGEALRDTFTPLHETVINDFSKGDVGAGLGEIFTGGVHHTLDNYFNGTSRKKFDATKKANDALNAPPVVDNKDYSQDAAWQKLNNQTQLEMGGNITKYNGPSHAESPLGGIPVGQDSLVEGGETRGLPNTQSKDYIYSDTLKVPGKKYSFAKASKMIESKHSKRDNDKMSSEQKELEINALMKTQEDLRTNMMDRAYKKAYGGPLNKKVLATGGTVVVPPEYYNTLNKYQTINPQNPKEANDVKAMIGSNIVPQIKTYQDQLNTALRAKYKLAATAPITNQYLSPEEVNTALGGKGQDYYDNFEAYQAYRAKTPKMPGRSVEGTDNTDPKVYGTRHVNLFKPYQTNTDVPTFAYGGGLNPMEVPEDPQFNPALANQLSQDQYANMVDQDINNGVFNNKQPGMNNPKSGNFNNFNTDNLYNAGNFLGGAYDIYRGLKGGDAVNYERVTPETVNPELVNYQPSRDMQRRDIKEGFKGVQQELRNVNNPAAYLSLMTANAGSRDKTISDSIAKSYENELNTNSTIKGRANEFNAQAKNQSKYFNASTQQAEANARQQEKDVASNTLQAGLASFGEALAGTGRDKQYRISEAESKKFIGSVDFTPTKDKNGKITGYTHKASGKTYKIQ